MNMEIYNGDRFYYKHSLNNNLNLRVVRIKNENTFNCKRNDGQLIKISKQELLDNYIRITPHGSLFISIVDMGDKLQDVVLSIFRMSDVKEKTTAEPWCVCRQHISDIFSETMNQNPYLKFSGVSISQNTIMKGHDFKEVLACNGIVENKKYSIYLDDSIEDLLFLIDKKYLSRMDNVLENLDNKMNDDFHEGYVKSLKELLEKNDFMYDFLEGFGIQRVSFPIMEPEGTELQPLHRYEIEKITSCEMLKTYVIPFNYSINMNEVKRSYQLVCDINNNIFIIAYDKGKYMTESLKESIKRNNDVYMNLKDIVANNKILQSKQ